MDPITLEVLQESNAFSIHYQNADPERARQMAQQIADLFLGYNRQTRNERAEATYNFLLAQSRDVEKRMAEVDERIAQFKARHGAALPEAQVRNQAAAERASRDLTGHRSADARGRGAAGAAQRATQQDQPDARQHGR